MAEYTPNLNLYKWQATDQKITTFSELNNNADTLDAEIEQLKNPDVTWTNLVLQNGALVFAAGSAPAYSKTSNRVEIKGAVTNITAANTVIGTLPVGFRPTGQAIPVAMPTTNANATTARFARWIINTNGAITLETTSDGAYSASHWFPIHANFSIG